ncbi:hypothetical protein STEG23_016366 [Scotinomys teguina]
MKLNEGSMFQHQQAKELGSFSYVVLGLQLRTEENGYGINHLDQSYVKVFPHYATFPMFQNVAVYPVPLYVGSTMNAVLSVSIVVLSHNSQLDKIMEDFSPPAAFIALYSPVSARQYCGGFLLVPDKFPCAAS